jgi:hypothetical protein
VSCSHVATSGFVGFWCQFFLLSKVENTSHDRMGIMRVDLSSILCFVFIRCVYEYLVSEYKLFYLHNKSSVIEHQFTSGGLFDFVYCAYNLLLGHDSIVAGGNRSMGVVEQGAVCIFIGLRERYFFVLQVWISTGDRDR